VADNDTELLREPPMAGHETDTLVGSLERQRATFAWKCGGLDHAGLTALHRCRHPGTLGPAATAPRRRPRPARPLHLARRPDSEPAPDPDRSHRGVRAAHRPRGSDPGVRGRPGGWGPTPIGL